MKIPYTSQSACVCPVNKNIVLSIIYLYYFFVRNQSTPLLVAAHSGHAAAIQMLLALGADVRADDKLDKTAVHLSAEQGKEEALKVRLHQTFMVLMGVF